MSVPSYWDPTHPLSSKCVPPWNQRGGHTHLRVKGLGGPNSDDWRECLAYYTNTNTIGAGGTSERQYIGAGGPRSANILAQGGLGAPIYWRRKASVRQYIGAERPRCANILAHQCPPPPIGNADQAQSANNIFFLFGPLLLLAQGASVRQ